jgi:hypothetical protein
MSDKQLEDRYISRVGGTAWSAYTEHQTEVGVRFEADHLLWWESPIFNPHTGGGAKEQSFEEFLASGPAFGWLSEEALAELEAAVEKRKAD